jgi:lysophospholipase L1-like esterase
MHLSRMRSRLRAGLTSAAASLAIVGLGASGAAACPRPAPASYYLSLGDSLSVGVQPDSHGQQHSTSQGYADDLYATEKAAKPGLRLVKLGCSGETTGSMIAGGICHYRGAASQLDTAVKFLAAHRGSVRLVTLDIGANDVDSCASPTTGLNAACTQAGLRSIASDLPQILHRLRAADPSARVRFAAMDYYDPFLATWLEGPAGRQLAAQSVTLGDTLNRILAQDYHRFGFSVAPVAQAFATHDTRPVTLPGVGSVPRNVATICELTWECAAPPVGPNIHARAGGYQVIAQAFRSALASRRD